MHTILYYWAALLLKSVYTDSWKALQVFYRLWHHMLEGIFSLLLFAICLVSPVIFAPQGLQKDITLARAIPTSLVIVQPLTRTGQRSGPALQCFYSLVQVSINHLKLPSGLNFPISHLEQVLPGYRMCCRKGTKTFLKLCAVTNFGKTDRWDIFKKDCPTESKINADLAYFSQLICLNRAFSNAWVFKRSSSTDLMFL